VGFYKEVDDMKYVTRWARCVESIQDTTASHSWAVATLALYVIKELNLDVDPLRSLEIALVHDMGECGMESDVQAYDVFRGMESAEDKERAERETMAGLLERHGRRAEYDAWTEYQEQKTRPAKFIKAIDKIEQLIHVLRRGEGTRDEEDGDHTALYADKAVSEFPDLWPLLRVIKKELKELYGREGKEWKPEYDEV
jgi:putative hydrolases of HD superfamily